MKKLFLTLVSCFVLFALGCQENSITEPLTSEVAEKDNFQEDTYNHGFIKLDGMLADPSRPLNCCLEIRGVIEYEHGLVFPDYEQQSSSYYVSLKLAIEAELFDPYSPTDPIWPISETSIDKIDVQPEQVHSLIKHFKLQDRGDNMFLVCKFIVTSEDVRLDGMWLKANGLHLSNSDVR
jgi:hypothetical protein